MMKQVLAADTCRTGKVHRRRHYQRTHTHLDLHGDYTRHDVAAQSQSAASSRLTRSDRKVSSIWRCASPPRTDPAHSTGNYCSADQSRLSVGTKHLAPADIADSRFTPHDTTQLDRRIASYRAVSIGCKIKPCLHRTKPQTELN